VRKVNQQVMRLLRGVASLVAALGFVATCLGEGAYETHRAIEIGFAGRVTLYAV
jgi:hypothetical protein